MFLNRLKFKMERFHVSKAKGGVEKPCQSAVFHGMQGRFNKLPKDFFRG